MDLYGSLYDYIICVALIKNAGSNGIILVVFFLSSDPVLQPKLLEELLKLAEEKVTKVNFGAVLRRT